MLKVWPSTVQMLTPHNSPSTVASWGMYYGVKKEYFLHQRLFQCWLLWCIREFQWVLCKIAPIQAQPNSLKLQKKSDNTIQSFFKHRKLFTQCLQTWFLNQPVFGAILYCLGHVVQGLEIFGGIDPIIFKFLNTSHYHITKTTFKIWPTAVPFSAIIVLSTPYNALSSCVPVAPKMEISLTSFDNFT